MRTLSDNLIAAQIAASISPLYKVALTYTGGANDATYEEDRILSITHREEAYHQQAEIVLNNSDKALTQNYQGFKGIISYGIQDGPTPRYSACAPLWVVDQQYHSSPGALTVTLTLKGLPDLLALDKASGSFRMLPTDVQTVKDLLTQVVKGVLPDWIANTAYSLDYLVIPITQNGLIYKCTTAGSSHGTTEPTWPTTIGNTVADNTVTWTCMGKELTVFSHCVAYIPTFDSEDSLIDVFKPADAFKFGLNETRRDAIKNLLFFTKNVMRAEDDGEIHFRTPVVSGGTYDYEYRLDVDNYHELFAKSNRNRVVFPNRIIVSSHPDSGDGYTGSAEDTASSDLTDMEKREHYYLRVVSNAQCDSIAAAILEGYQSASQKGAAQVPMNVGQEVHDYILLTDARQGDTRAGNIAHIERTAGGGQWFMNIAFGEIALGGFLGLLGRGAAGRTVIKRIPYVRVVEPTTPVVGSPRWEAQREFEQRFGKGGTDVGKIRTRENVPR